MQSGWRNRCIIGGRDEAEIRATTSRPFQRYFAAYLIWIVTAARKHSIRFACNDENGIRKQNGQIKISRIFVADGRSTWARVYPKFQQM